MCYHRRKRKCRLYHRRKRNKCRLAMSLLVPLVDLPQEEEEEEAHNQGAGSV